MSIPWFTREQLDRFIKATLTSNPRPVEPNDARAAAWALLAALGGRDIRKDIGTVKKPGQRGREIPLSAFTLDHPAMGVVLRWRSGELKYKGALEEFQHVTGLKERTAKNYLKALKPRAESTIKTFDLMKSLATNTPPPKRKL